VDSIVRALAVYLVLLVIFRVAGRRTLANTTTFDLVLTLIISEAVQQALIETDNSMTNALLLVLTLVGTDVVLSLAKQRWKRVQKVVEGLPIVIVERGKMHHDRMERERVDEEDVLAAARSAHGLRRFDEIDYAVVEPNGEVSVIPKRSPT
jgi:uncharacterized membrane protein YcaP (DUF421 family)